jgi:hypothetical protein
MRDCLDMFQLLLVIIRRHSEPCKEISCHKGICARIRSQDQSISAVKISCVC